MHIAIKLHNGVGRCMFTFSLVQFPGVNIVILSSRMSSDLYSVQSTLEYKVEKEDKDARFSCEVSFFVPDGIRTIESPSVNITVHCELTLRVFILSCKLKKISVLSKYITQDSVAYRTIFRSNNVKQLFLYNFISLSSSLFINF